MRRVRAFAALSLLFCAPLLCPGADLSLPKTVQGNPGSFIKIPATTDGKVVKWYALDPGLNLFPIDLLKDTKTAVVVGTTPGSYRLLAYTDGPSDPAVCVVVVGQAPTPPPGPTPTDPFAQALQAAYAKEADAGKAQEVAFLAAVYQGAPALLTAGVTAGELFTKLQAAVHAPGVGLPSGALPGVMRVLGDDMNKVLGTSPSAAVDPAAAKAAFARYAAALSALR